MPSFRVESGRGDWEKGHIPGAGYIDLDGDLSDKTSKFWFTTPSAQHFAAAMSAYGVGDEKRVILYSAKSNWWATRIWWMLRAFGFDDAAVLNGGWEKWTRESRPVCAEPCTYQAADFIARPRPELIVYKENVAAAINNRGVCIVNALTRKQYTGESETHYGRPGRIPSSVNVPYLDLIDRNTNAFLPLAELRARLDAVGAMTAEKVISYCGGGIAATSLAFALALLGREDVAVYDGSMTEWSADPALPVETG